MRSGGQDPRDTSPVDNRVASSYILSMRRSARILVVVILAAFGAGTAMQTATAAVMTVKMALADSGGMDMSDCGGCADDDGSSPACDDFCAAPLLAIGDPGKTAQPVLEETSGHLAAHATTGRTGPPDPYPPRIVLI